MNTDRLIQIAKDIKSDKQTGTHFVVAFATIKGRIIRLACNHYTKTDPIAKDSTRDDGEIVPYLHAETSLIKKLGYREDKNRIKIYVVRITNSGKIGSSKPCSHCAFTLGKNQYESIYYVNDSGDFERL